MQAGTGAGARAWARARGDGGLAQRSMANPSSLPSPPLFLIFPDLPRLQCPVVEVENWVVMSITSGLLDCRIDQAARQVVVSRCTERVFDAAAWRSLQGTLHAWQATVGSLLRGAEDAILPR